ncbi:MAG: DUF4340 domain-containing protein [Chloroflexaceae bacterium]|nr:DUF4340 domain-containing protein [Chloroflexaceae bacterium]
MKLQTSTWALIAIAAITTAAGGIIYWYDAQIKPQREAKEAETQQVFDFEETEIERLRIEKAQETLLFSRTTNPERPWQMRRPEYAPASEAAVSYLVNLLVEGQADQILTVPARQLPEYGLDQPQATIMLDLKQQESRQLILGKISFDGQFIYGTTDALAKPATEVEIFLLPIDFQYAINRELAEWKESAAPIPDSP